MYHSFTGRLVDAFKNYALIFYMAGGELLTAGVFLATASYCCIGRKRSKNSPNVEEPEVEEVNHANHDSDNAHQTALKDEES